VSDDDDVDMSLFFTIRTGDTSATVIEMCENNDFDVGVANADSDGFCLPHGDGWLKGCVEVL
jgi:hypothetical protein